MTRKITWLLDLDGVVNCTAPSWGECPWKTHVTTPGNHRYDIRTWRLRWAPTLVKRILAVNALSHVEVVWCSTWCEPDIHGVPQIRWVEQAICLPELRCAFTHPPGKGDREAVHSAKRQAALQVLDSGQDLIWTDDEVVPPLGDSFRDILMERADHMLLIRPAWNKGLTRDDMSLIESFTKRS